MLQNLKRILMATAMLGHIPSAIRGATMPPVKQYRRGMKRSKVDLRYTERSFRNPGKRYPFSSTRQEERFAKNYASDANGVIRPLSKQEKRDMR